jgi:riboflavin kinase / FMN adenylyltransferase
VKPNLSIFRQAPAPELRPPCALSIGNFDGVHRGHQVMIAQVCEAADRLGLSPTILTFAPHPRQYFAHLNRRPELSPPQITGLRDKLTALACAGINRVVLARFNQSMAEMTASDFVTQWLAIELNVRWVLVGEDFRFGRQRAGDIHLLKELGHQCGIEVHTLSDITDEQGRRISSSEVRGALAAGEMSRAASLLGRPYGMTGHIVHGKKLGRTLDMPTMNMRVTPRCAARSGIYVVRAHGLGSSPLPGVASLGVRPTVENDGRILLETHLFDLNVDAYGKLVRVELLQHLRDEEKFPDLPTLTAAMHADAQHARAYFALHGL